MKPNPTWPASHSDRNRKLFCSHVSDCLDVAIKESWSGLSCRACQVEQSKPLDREMNVARCLSLVKAVTSQLLENGRDREQRHALKSAVSKFCKG